jgi:hypothetical protein
VLPSVTNAELLDLEAVLQKQREHKDDYNLVSELMMLKTLHEQAEMTEQQIAKRQRLKPQEVTDRLAILALMERTRRLPGPGRTLPLSRFAQGEDQLQNWKELLKRVHEAEARAGADEGDRVIRGWLLAYVLGYDSVHKLRGVIADSRWIEKDVIEHLADGEGTPGDIARAVGAPTQDGQPEPLEEPEGVSLLDPGGGTKAQGGQTTVSRLLGLTLDAVAADDGGTVVLPDGKERPAVDVVDRLRASVGHGIEASKRRIRAGQSLARPAHFLTDAQSNLRSALDSLDDVLDEAAFAPHIKTVQQLAEEIADLTDEVLRLLANAEKPSTAGIS